MSRAAWTFKKRDVVRAVQAAKEAGVEIARIEIGKDGQITLVTGKPSETKPKQTEAEDYWDTRLGLKK